MSTGIAFWLAMFLIYLGLCTVAGMIASMRERSFLGAFVLAFLLSEPPREFRRLLCVSHAAMASSPFRRWYSASNSAGGTLPIGSSSR